MLRPLRLRWRLSRTAALVGLLCGPTAAAAQPWLASPVTLADGRVAIGAELSLTYGSEDPGYFNYTDYETSALRRIRAGLAVSAAPTRRLALLTEFRAETGGHAEAYAYYVRVTPWPGHPIDVQAGKVPPVFGTFSRRGYPQDNPLIGDPLVYQYLTSARSDALPATPSDILRMRGRGWRASYPVGNPTPGAGMPLVAAFDWNLGIQARVGLRPVELNVAWTPGNLSWPEDVERPGHGEFSGRLAVKPAPGAVFGVSAARGTFVVQQAFDALPPEHREGGRQSAFGIDAEYASGHVVLRAELVFNRWLMPAAASPPLDLDTLGGYAEARYRVLPSLYVAARAERLAYGDITAETVTAPWEARVTRVELGGGYSMSRRSRLKAVYQLNVRDGGRVRRSHLGAAQLVVWF
jgi:hypothetical protein